MPRATIHKTQRIWHLGIFEKLAQNRGFYCGITAIVPSSLVWHDRQKIKRMYLTVGQIVL